MFYFRPFILLLLYYILYLSALVGRLPLGPGCQQRSKEFISILIERKDKKRVYKGPGSAGRGGRFDAPRGEEHRGLRS